MSKLSVSVALCTYNGARYITQQLDSILRQTLKPDEIIICDDCSTDRTVDLLEEYAREHPSLIRLVKNSENMGRNENFSRAIGLCRKDVIVLSDQDDVFLPHKIEMMVRALERDQECGLVFTNAVVVDENLEPLSEDLFSSLWPPFGRRRKEMLENDNAFKVLVRNCPANGCCIAFREELRRFILPIPDFRGHDSWIVDIAALFSKVRFIDEKPVLYRQHGSNLAGVYTSIPRKLKARLSRDPEDYHRDVLSSLRHWTALRERALSLVADDANDLEEFAESIRWIDGRIGYLNKRVAISSERGRLASRAAKALCLLVNSRYFTYGRGMYSFARDIIVALLRTRRR